MRNVPIAQLAHESPQLLTNRQYMFKITIVIT